MDWWDKHFLCLWPFNSLRLANFKQHLRVTLSQTQHQLVMTLLSLLRRIPCKFMWMAGITASSTRISSLVFGNTKEIEQLYWATKTGWNQIINFFLKTQEIAYCKVNKRCFRHNYELENLDQGRSVLSTKGWFLFLRKSTKAIGDTISCSSNYITSGRLWSSMLDRPWELYKKYGPVCH